MQYILGKNVILRGYIDLPYASYFRGCSDGIRMTEEEHRILEQAYTPYNPTRIETESGVWESLLRRGFIEPYTGDTEVRPYQKYRYCNNYYIPAANWAITGKCNYNCLHCFNASDNSASQDEFSYQEAMRLLEEFDKCGIINITLTGGEPMIHPDFLEIVKKIDEKGMVLSEITTNGECITQEFLDGLLELGCKPLFKLSFDGLGHHDWLRNKKGSEKKIIGKIQMLLENDFAVQLQTSVNKRNLDSILGTASFFDELGVPYMRIIRTSESPRWLQNGAEYTLSMMEYYNFGLDFAEQYMDIGKHMKVYLWQTLAIAPETKSYYHSNVKIQPSEYRKDMPVCMHNKRRISITPSGEAIPCSQMSGWLEKQGDAFENVHKTELAEILRDSLYFRTVNYSVGELYEKAADTCGSCQYRNVCLGGCRACAVLFDGQKLRTETGATDKFSPYYQSRDSFKCLFFAEYKNQFDNLFHRKGWMCENTYNM